MAKIQIKSEKLTPFGGIQSWSNLTQLSSVIDSTKVCSSFGCSEIASIYFCGGSCIEDVTTHLMNHPSDTSYSSDTILRVIKERTQGNISYTLRVDFKKRQTAQMFASGQLKEGDHDVDFDH